MILNPRKQSRVERLAAKHKRRRVFPRAARLLQNRLWMRDFMRSRLEP